MTKYNTVPISQQICIKFIFDRSSRLLQRKHRHLQQMNYRQNLRSSWFSATISCP